MLDLLTKAATETDFIFREAQTTEEIEELLNVCRNVYAEIGVSEKNPNLPGPCSFDLIDNFSSHFGLYNPDSDQPIGYIRVTNSRQMAGIDDNYFSVFRHFPGSDLVKCICDKIIEQGRTIVEIGRMAILKPYRTNRMAEFIFDAVNAWTFYVKGIEFALSVPWPGLYDHCKEFGYNKFPGSDRLSVRGCDEPLECLLASLRTISLEYRPNLIQMANSYIMGNNISPSDPQKQIQSVISQQYPENVKVA